MKEQELIPHLFRTEYRNIVSVLCYRFGIEHIEIAEDIVSDTFLSATELWSLKGLPGNPTGWLYTVAQNKTKNHLKRNTLFDQKISTELRQTTSELIEMEIDLSRKNIADSQLAMMFTVCHPGISADSQIALALNLLCGFGIQEIADAFLTNKEVVYKRINRAKEKLKADQIQIVQPSVAHISSHLETVLKTIYLLFSEGHYSISTHTVLRQDVCEEAMRLNQMLIENPATSSPSAKALQALMYFHASRFPARIADNGDAILYHDQDQSLWNRDLIAKGTLLLNGAATGSQLSRYHMEAGIAYWHTQKEDTAEKWEAILDLYNMLLILEYSPIAALNRTYALGKVRGKQVAIAEAEKLQLIDNSFYYSLLGSLYTDINSAKALENYQSALKFSSSAADQKTINKHIFKIRQIISDL